MPRDLWYIGVIVALVGFSAACLQANRPRDCSKTAEMSLTIGYTKGIIETLEMGL